jgi:hypothetical protein
VRFFLNRSRRNKEWVICEAVRNFCERRSRWRFFLSELATWYGRKGYLMRAWRPLPAKLDRPCFLLCPSRATASGHQPNLALVFPKDAERLCLVLLGFEGMPQILLK